MASNTFFRPIFMNRIFALCCLGMSMSLVGSYVALSKPLTLVFPVLLLAWLRFGIGGVAMLHWLKKAPGEPVMSSQTKRLIFLESFLGNFLFSICMLFGISLSTAVNAGIILAGIPAAVALLSWVYLREPITLRVWLAVGLSVCGILVFSLSKNMTPTTISTHWFGSLLLVGALLCEAAYAVIGKKLIATLSPKRISALINLWGFILMTPLGLYGAWSFNFGSVAPSMWVMLIFYALAASVWTVWLWMTGLQTIAAAQAGIFTVFLPVTAAFVGVFVLGEKLSVLQIVALGIALLGVVLATLPTSAQSEKDS